jgi:RNA polymerase sigma-70 factor (ECF subfamily)
LTSALSSSVANELPSDGQLVSRTLAGEKRAFNELVLRHERRLFRFLSRGSANAADVEDAMQQAMLKAYVNLSRYNPRWRFTTWLFTIALRELRSLERRRPKTRETAKEPASPAVVHAVEEDDPGELWRAARRLLKPQHYTALWLRHGEDLSVAEVAKVIGRPRVWVSVTLHRACATLRSALEDRAGAKGIRPIRGVS